MNTARLVLRRIKESDAKELFDGFVNQDEFLYYANKKKVTLAEETRSLTGIDEKYKDNEYYNWVIAIKDSGKIIGSINLRSNNYNDSVEFNASKRVMEKCGMRLEGADYIRLDDEYHDMYMYSIAKKSLTK